MERSYLASVYAKLNLNLEITGKENGLHTIKSVVCPYDYYVDEAEFYPTEGGGEVKIKVSADFDGFDEARFLSFFAPKIQAIADKLGVSGELIVRKGIPLGAGLGGSSASIVAGIRAMSKYAKEIGKSTELDSQFLLSLGSDVPCMLFINSKDGWFYGGICAVSGVGEILKGTEVPLYVNDLRVEIADGGSDTKACYALYDELVAKGEDTTRTAGGILPDRFVTLRGEELFKNELTLPATILNPEIERLIERMRKRYKLVVMIGSGSAVIGLGKK